MRYLLDTQIAIWAISGTRGSMGPNALAAISDPVSHLYVSVVSLWEMTIKQARGKLDIPGGDVAVFASRLIENGVELLPISIADLSFLALLPHLHKDPFDRILVAQAQAEAMTLISSDSVLPAYEVSLIG